MNFCTNTDLDVLLRQISEELFLLKMYADNSPNNSSVINNNIGYIMSDVEMLCDVIEGIKKEKFSSKD